MLPFNNCTCHRNTLQNLSHENFLVMENFLAYNWLYLFTGLLLRLLDETKRRLRLVNL